MTNPTQGLYDTLKTWAENGDPYVPDAPLRPEATSVNARFVQLERVLATLGDELQGVQRVAELRFEKYGEFRRELRQVLEDDLDAINALRSQIRAQEKRIAALESKLSSCD